MLNQITMQPYTFEEITNKINKRNNNGDVARWVIGIVKLGNFIDPVGNPYINIKEEYLYIIERHLFLKNIFVGMQFTKFTYPTPTIFHNKKTNVNLYDADVENRRMLMEKKPDCEFMNLLVS